MKFSAQEEYGFRCLLEIARYRQGGSTTIPEIARRENLSESHVAKLLMILRRAGLILSTRGHTGGYRLARPASEITVGEVLSALGGRLVEDDFCNRHGGIAQPCVHLTQCSLHSLWQTIQDAVDEVTSRISLQEILDQGEANAIFRSSYRELPRLSLTSEPARSS